MDKNKIIYANCDVCSSKSYEKIWGQPPNVVCKKCGFLFINPKPSKKFLNKYYKHNLMSSGSVYCETGNLSRQRKFDKAKIAYIKKNTKLKKGKVLEIGCNRGKLLKLFDKTKWQRYGLEPSKKSFKLINNKSLKVYCSILEDTNFQKKYFDLIICASVLEHVLSPRKFLRKIRSILKNDGYLYILVPNIFDPLFHRSDFDIEEHLSHFSRKTLMALLINNGFEIVHINEDHNYKFLELISVKSKKRVLDIENEYSRARILSVKENIRVKREEKRIKNLIISNVKNWQDKGKKIGVYGAGLHSLYLEKLTNLSKKGVFYFDSDHVKQKVLFLNKKVFSPSKIRTLNVSKFIISSEPYQEEIFDTIKQHAPNSEVLKLY